MKKHRTPPSFLRSDSEINGAFVLGQINRHRRIGHFQGLSSWLLRVSLGLVLLIIMGMLGACTAVAPGASTGSAAAGEATAASAEEQPSQTPQCSVSADMQYGYSTNVRALPGIEVAAPQLGATDRLITITVPPQVKYSTFQVRLLPWNPDVPMDGVKAKVLNFDVLSDTDEIISEFDPPIELNVECPADVCPDSESTSTATLVYFDEGKCEWTPFTSAKNGLEQEEKDGKIVFHVKVEQWGDRHIAWGDNGK